MERRTQLLSPAGSPEIFRAVLMAGADAVYAGAKRFSARAYADNFTDAQLLRAIDEAHVRGRKFYLAMNTLIKDAEMCEALHTVETFYEAGVDGVILQDFGLSAQIARQFPDLARHASTQMAVSGPCGMRFLQENGFTQAVLPRELSLPEIRTIAQQTDIRLECFIHGALCYCCSGRCLMSSMIGGRSANRGKCAQPCRLPYTTGTGKPPDIYPLSLKDLCAADAIGELIDAGVTSFKIEGRMKGLEYAAGTTQIYREIIDRATERAGRGEAADGLSRETRRNLEALGSRSGFTNGYLKPDAGGKMISLRRPSHRRETENAFVRQVRETYTKEPQRIPADLAILIRRGEKVRLSMRACGRSVSVTGEYAQDAADRPLDADTVREKITKLGGTPFTAASCEIMLDPACFVPLSQLNRMRQQAAGELTAALRPRREEAARAAEKTAGARDDTQGTENAQNAGTDEADAVMAPDAWIRPSGGAAVLFVSVVNDAQLKAVLREKETDAVILDCDAYPPGKKFLQGAARIHEAGKKCVLALPQTFRVRTQERFRKAFGGTRTGPQALKNEADAYLVRNADEIAFLHDPDIFEKIPLFLSDGGVYCWNREAKAFWLRNGAALLTASYELKGSEIDAADQILTLYGNTPLMVSAQCIRVNLSGSCAKEQGEKAPLFLRDRKGKRFPVRTLCESCENVIYNCVPTDLFREGKKILRMGFSGYRMDFLSEDAGRIRECYHRYRAFLSGEKIDQPDDPFTCGAWKRGTE